MCFPKSLISCQQIHFSKPVFNLISFSLFFLERVSEKEMQGNLSFATESGDTTSKFDDDGRPKRTGNIYIYIYLYIFYSFYENINSLRGKGLTSFSFWHGF